MDDIDRGQEREQQLRDRALADTLRRIRRTNEAAPAAASRNCATCGEPIDARRLRAVPTTRYCVECKQRRERHA